MSDPVYRCACSWVGSDPDTIRVTRFKCTGCLKRGRRCKTGECLHCDACDLAWLPAERSAHTTVHTCPACYHHDRKLVVVTTKALTRIAESARIPDLFREGSKTAETVRWLLQQGRATYRDFKFVFESLGGTTHSTHAFDRYYVGIRHSQFVPTDGSYGVIMRFRDINGRQCLDWVGSEGATFEARAAGWVKRLSPKALDRALAMFERRWTTEIANSANHPSGSTLESAQESIARVWYQALQHEIAVRSDAMRASVPANAANEVSTATTR